LIGAVPYSVIQWATGAMGKTCLRAIIDHPDLELVGLYVYSDGKAGRDAGEIARRPPTGVIATHSVEEILALQADVVVHAARLPDSYGEGDAELQAILRSGKNVISINGHTFPQYWSGERAQAFEAACIAGGASFMGAGLNPGFVAEKMAITATSICSRVDWVETREVVDCRDVRSPDYVFGKLGFGADPAAIEPNDPAWPPAAALNGMYSEVIALTAMRLGFELDAIETEHSLVAAVQNLSIAAGIIPKGRVCQTNWRWHGMADGRRRVTTSIAWTMDPDQIGEDAPLWRIRIEGSPNVNIAIDLERPADDPGRTSAEQWGLAGAVVNAIPIVCSAAPGIVATPIATPYRA
jgi:hypothetical protein